MYAIVQLERESTGSVLSIITEIAQVDDDRIEMWISDYYPGWVIISMEFCIEERDDNDLV